MRYSKERKGKFPLANFLLGQAKLAIYKTHKTEKEEGKGKDLVGVFKVMVRIRVAADFACYKISFCVSTSVFQPPMQWLKHAG